MSRLSRGGAQHGMTLIELMVGMAVGLFLLSVMGTITVGSKTTFNAQESTSRLQENGRFVVDLLAADLRMAGFHGCAGQVGGQSAINNTLATPAAQLYNFGRAVAGSHYAGNAWSPALDANVAALAPLSGGDIITVYRSSGSAWSLTANMASGTADLQVTPTANITTGDLLAVADCSGGAVFQATNANPGVLGLIQHQAGVGGISPGVASASLGRAYLQDATVYRLQTVTYYLAASARQAGVTSLWSYTAPAYGLGVQPVELVTGVDQMSVTYGLDTNADRAADTFVTANAVADWTQVVSARLELLLSSSDDNTATSPQPYVFGGVTTTPTDRRLRTVVSLEAALRNAVP